MNKVILEVQDVNKSFIHNNYKLEVIKQACLKIYQGEIVGLIGPSGSGKSTLLHICGLLDQADSGKVIIDNQDCSNISDKAKTFIRRDKIGFIYQKHYLLDEFTALENIMLPMYIAGMNSKDAQKKAYNLLDRLGISNRAKHFPTELSGGEQQRIAIARALANDPILLLADEPTGNLDPANANNVFNIFIELARQIKLSLLVVTHNIELTKQLNMVYTIDQGCLVEQKR